MIIVSDTSPLSSLFLIGRLDLLPEICFFASFVVLGVKVTSFTFLYLFLVSVFLGG